MKILIKAAFTAILIGLTTAPLFSQGFRRQSTTLSWHTNAKEAFAESAKSNLPILAVFR